MTTPDRPPAPCEQTAGNALWPLTVPAAEIEERRRQAYISHELFLRESLLRLAAERPERWQRDYSSPTAYSASVEPMRQRLQAMLGFWSAPESRPTPEMREHEPVGVFEGISVSRFRLEVLPGLETYGYELRPPGAGRKAGLVVQHGYNGTPEEVCGFAANPNGPDYSYRSIGIRAARRGYLVLAVHHPSGPGVADKRLPGVPAPTVAPLETNGQNRLDRLARLQGATALGLYMLTTSRAVDLLLANTAVDPGRIGLYGLSQGGETALLLPAIDVRLRASVSSAFFNDRLRKLIGPIPRSVAYIDWLDQAQFLPDQVRWFSDADLVSLIAPRAFAAENGMLDSAVTWECAAAEAERARLHYEKLGIPERFEFILHAEGHVSATRRAFAFLEAQLG